MAVQESHLRSCCLNGILGDVYTRAVTLLLVAKEVSAGERGEGG